jgi:5'-3' exonuclease
MGIRKLNKYLVNNNLINTYHNIEDFAEKIRDNSIINRTENNKIIIAIDFWLYVHKFLHSNKSDNILIGFLNQIFRFLLSGIIPLYVMDGSIPLEKQDIIFQRTRKRNNNLKKINDINHELNLDDSNEYIDINDLIDKDIHVSKLEEKKIRLEKSIKRVTINDLSNIYELFTTLNIPFIRANYEADAMCAKLYKNHIISSCLSDDMDMLALGCGSTIKFQGGKLIEYDLNSIKDKLNITQEQFIDMCILFGCDYLKHPLKIECEDVYQLIKTYGSLLNALECGDHESFNMKNAGIRIIGENYYQVKDVYLTSINRENIPSNMFNIKMKYIEFDTFALFLKSLDWFDTSFNNLKNIKHEIDKINDKIIDDIL